MKHIIIAPYLEGRKLFSVYRKNDPFTEVKFFTKSSFLSNFYYQYSENALLYISNKYGKDYDISNQILNAISKMQVCDTNYLKFKELENIKNELLKEKLIYRNEYIEQELKDSQIDIYFYSEKDKELNNFLKNRNVNYIKCENSVPTQVECFHSNRDELSYVFNKIASLLDQGVDGSKIAIYGLEETDELIFNRLCSNYKFHINNVFQKTLLSKVYVNQFVANVLEVGVELAFEETKSYSFDEYYSQFSQIVKKYNNPKVSLVCQSEIYQTVFNKVKLSSKKYSDGIEVVDEPICPEEGYLFIVNMIQGKFPTLSKDNEYLSDREKEQLKIPTSEDENTANYQLFTNYLMQKGHIFLSYSNSSFSAKYYPSPFIKTFGITTNNEHKIDTYYSFNEAQFAYANELDVERNYLLSSELLKKFRNSKDIIIPYQTYTYEPGNIKFYDYGKVIRLSNTKITQYFECPYKYYLENILEIDESEDNFSLSLGKLAHRILQDIPTGKSFDELYEIAYEANKDGFEKDDWVFLKRIKKDLKRVFDYIIEFESQIKDSTFEREKRIEINLDNQIVLKGIIDKLIIDNTNYRVAIVDYKTGKQKFEEPLIQYGFSLQLPIYSLIIKEIDPYNKFDISGLFIQPLLLDNKESFYSRVVENDLNSNSKLCGMFSNKEGIINYFDSTEKTTSSKYIQGVTYKLTGEFESKTLEKMKDQFYFDSLANVAKEKILDAGHDILNNKFDIRPKKIGENDKSCTYCRFRDICYRDDNAYEKINLKKNNEKEEKPNGLN